ncbi:RsbT co-antagonist protein RsbRA [Bacillus sp. FJAT-45350]|uniref:RsbT co-antagonist protein RsbRA n=1 Tax=Bacillus sp. FJAT-45350 TaxID=2011014 RepID=UPI000BB8C552|nr:RsbT co-antagonist protein RsbRA [Bacillus sp. FJAT-45350]
MELSVIDFIYEHKESLRERWLEEVKDVRREEHMQKISDTDYVSTTKEFMQIIINNVEYGQEKANEQLTDYADRYIKKGWPLVYFTQGLQTFRRVIFEVMSEKEKSERPLIESYYEVENWIDGLINQLVHTYSGSWESTFEMQKLSLLELSAPLIPVFEHISVMPLIGTIDTGRARLIMENLLEGVIKHRSQVVLIDITGVPVVDTMVANHIIQASEAVRLVGAQCILVGIRPEIAQTIVNLGIDLSRFPTKSSLRKGIETALELTNKKITEI